MKLKIANIKSYSSYIKNNCWFKTNCKNSSLPYYFRTTNCIVYTLCLKMAHSSVIPTIVLIRSILLWNLYAVQGRLQQEIVGSSISSESQQNCPTWFTPVLHKNGTVFCECNDKSIEDGTVLKCPSKREICLNCMRDYGRDELNVSIFVSFCMTHNFTTDQTILGVCPYHQARSSRFDFFFTLPSNLSDLNGFMCHVTKHKGELCNRCIDGHGLGVFNENEKCLTCKHVYVSNWIWFIGLELIPPTLVFVVILLCRIPANTGPLNAFIFISQIISTIVAMKTADTEQNFSTSGNVIVSKIAKGIEVFYSFWFDQYIWNVNLCISKDISAIQVIALEYVSPLCMLFLILSVSICIKLHYNGCRLLNVLQRPFLCCARKLAINCDPLSSIVNAFATFIVLVYTKILFISFNLIAPSRVYNQSGELPFKILSYDSSIHFLSRQHTAYVCLALIMLVLFCVLPLLVLFVLPTKCFAMLLNRKSLNSLNWAPLHAFSDAFMGCYKNRTGPEKSECRYFASLYLVFRFLFLFCLFFVQYSYTWLTLVSISILMFLLFAVIQPYRENWLNIVDSVAFFLVAVAIILFSYEIHVAKLPKWLLGIIICIPIIYFISFISYKVIIQRCFIKCHSTERNQRASRNT